MWRYVGWLQTFPDGKSTMSIYERKASIREFYGECFGILYLCIDVKPKAFYYWGIMSVLEGAVGIGFWGP